MRHSYTACTACAAIVAQQWCNSGDYATGCDLTSGTYRGIIFVRKPLAVKSEDSVDHKSSQGIARSAARELLDLAIQQKRIGIC